MTDRATDGDKPVTRRECHMTHGESSRDMSRLRWFIVIANGFVGAVMLAGVWLGWIAYAQARTNERDLTAIQAARLESNAAILRELERINAKLDKLDKHP